MSDMAIIAPRLAKLLPMLATDHDGEVVATARTIGRTLKGAGMDFHSLVEVLCEPKPATYAPPPWKAEPAPQPVSLRDIAVWLRTHATHRMDFRERKFVVEMASRLSMGQQASTKQEKWLRAIFYRLYGINGEYVP